MLTTVTLPGMEDKPAVEYHPFGTITLNFDEGPVKLRRCRLGDLQFAKDLLEEIRTEKADLRQQWVDEASRLQTKAQNPDEPDLKTMSSRLNELVRLLEEMRIDIVWHWLAKVATRMGDNPLPAKDDWPVEMLDANVPNEIIDHWQTRPLASGKTLGNSRTTPEAGNSGPPPLTVSSPPAPQPQ